MVSPGQYKKELIPLFVTNTSNKTVPRNTADTNDLESVRAILPGLDDAQQHDWKVSIFHDGDGEKAPEFAVFHRTTPRKRPGVSPGRNVGVNFTPTEKDGICAGQRAGS